VVSLLCILGWAVPALVMADRGFSVQDEGSYVLSYRWWGSNPYFVSGAQYFYGPIFTAVHERIGALRVLRLVMVIGTNAWFAVVFVRWLAQHRGAQALTGQTTWIAVLTAAGGLSYLWAPLTPGYYDLTADASIALVALMLSTLRRASQPPAWAALLAGFIAFVLVLTKWPAVLVVILVQGVVLYEVSRVSRGGAVRYALRVVAGLAVTAIACQLFLVRLTEVVPAMREVSALTATASHGVRYLGLVYLEATVLFATAAVVFAVPLVAGYAAATRLASHGYPRSAQGCVLAGGVIVGIVIPLAVGWHGGRGGGVMLAVAMGALVGSLIAAGLPRASSVKMRRPQRVSERWVVAVLVGVPVLQAAGTNVSILYVSAECLALWIALVPLVASRAPRSRISVFAVETNLIVCVAAVALLAGSTTLLSPFNTTGVSSDTVRVADLGGQRLAPTTAREYAGLEQAVAPYVERGVTPVLTLDRLAGLTYLVGGVPMGSTWTDPWSVSRTAGILELACRNGDVDREHIPVLILDRGLDPAVIRALRGCGFDYPSEFRRLAVPGGPPGLQVLVPR
jgi:hypothetical protein